MSGTVPSAQSESHDSTGTRETMDVAVGMDRRRAFRVEPDSWRSPDIAWDYQDIIDLAAATATGASPWLLVPASLRLMLPDERVRSWAIIVVDDHGGVHRGPGESDRGGSVDSMGRTADASLFARAVTWLWASGTSADAFVDGAAYVDTWFTDEAVEAVACLPLIRDGVVVSVIAVWLTGPDTDAVLRDVSRLTILGHLWPGAHVWAPDGGEEVARGMEGEELTPRQLTILRAMARGLTNAQIAREISFSESTVRLESMCIYRHFDVHSRAEAVEAARETGVL